MHLALHIGGVLIASYSGLFVMVTGYAKAIETHTERAYARARRQRSANR